MRFPLLISISALLASSSCTAASRDKRHGHPQHGYRHNLGGRSTDGEKRDDVSAIYRPINVVTSRSTGRIQARDTTHLPNMDPADSAHMVFGKPGKDQALHVADMVLYAQQDLPIVMMEAFEGLTSAVDCEGDDGQLSLTFASAEAFNHSLNSWSYIHEDADRQFLMITNHDGCAPQGERQAYKITDVDNDEANYIVRLAASPTPWNEIAGSFDMEFGQATLDPSTENTLRARGAFDWFDETVDKVKDGAGDVVDDVKNGVGDVVDDVKDVADDVKDGAGDVVDDIKDTGDGDVSKSVTVPFSIGEEDKETLLFEDFTTIPPKLKLFCTNCFVDAQFETTGKIKVEDFKPTSLLLDVVPKDFRAAIELRAEIAQKNPDSDMLKFEKALLETAIPGAGIVVPSIFTLGAKAAFNIQGAAMVFGTATISFGGKTSLPNGSKVSIDLVDHEKSEVSGFESADVEPVFDVDQAALTANLIAGPQAALTFGVEVLDQSGIEAALTFGTPTFNLNVTAGFDETGFCASNDSVTSGIETVSAANVDMILAINAKASENKETSLFRRKMVNIPVATFLDECKPVPGLTSPNAATTTTSTATGKSSSSSSTSIGSATDTGTATSFLPLPSESLAKHARRHVMGKGVW